MAKLKATATIPVCTGQQNAGTVTRYLAANGAANAVAWWQPNMGTAQPNALPPMPVMLAAMAAGNGALFVRGQWGVAKKARGTINPRGVRAYAWRRGALALVG
jgi:hypothetical protein|tara:strand:- start:378 stop:686 length:309 start_codon:yes stop_codon:yes gene_type:complete